MGGHGGYSLPHYSLESSFGNPDLGFPKRLVASTYLLNNELIVILDGNLVFHFPSSNFHASVDVNSHGGIEPHSLEVSIGLESIDLTVDLVQELIGRLKPRKPTKPASTPPPQPTPLSPLSPSLFSPMSSSIQFMVGEIIFLEIFRSHPPPVIASRIHRNKGPQENVPRCERFSLSTFVSSF